MDRVCFDLSYIPVKAVLTFDDSVNQGVVVVVLVCHQTDAANQWRGPCLGIRTLNNPQAVTGHRLSATEAGGGISGHIKAIRVTPGQWGRSKYENLFSTIA